MKPYYSELGITIYHGDCREILPSLAPFKFDAIIADPPYGETSLNWDRQVGGWARLAGFTASSMWCFGSLQMFMDMAAAGQLAGWKRSQEIVWEKQNGSSFHADRFKRVHELAVHFYQGEWRDIQKFPVKTADATARTTRRKRRPTHTGHIEEGPYTSFDGGPRLMRSVIYAANCHGYAEHPTQKPEAIVEPLMQYSVPVGGIVLDPFMGSGTTLAVAKRLGIRAIGIETQEKYCEVAARRLLQGTLLEPVA